METVQNNIPEISRRKSSILPKLLKNLLLILLLGNLIFLNYKILFEKNTKTEEKQKITDQDFSTLDLQSKIDAVSQDIEDIRLALASSAATSTNESSTKVVEKETFTEKIIEEKSSVKEFYIPLGSASFRTENFQWQDTGAEALVDLSKYGELETMVFEASLSVPAGQAEARLYNVTDNYEVGGSRIIADGVTPKLYSSGSLNFFNQAKTYRVQVRTSLYYVSLMDNARLKLTIK